MTPENPRQAADVGRRATNSPPMDPEPTPTLIGRLSDQEREALAAAGLGRKFRMNALQMLTVERIVRAHAERAWDEGWRAAWSPLAMHGLGDGPNPYRDARQEQDR